MKREAILFFLGCSEVNSTWLITSELANQRARKALFTCLVYTNPKYYYTRKTQIEKTYQKHLFYYLYEGNISPGIAYPCASVGSFGETIPPTHDLHEGTLPGMKCPGTSLDTNVTYLRKREPPHITYTRNPVIRMHLHF